MADSHDETAMGALLAIKVMMKTHDHRFLNRIHRLRHQNFVPFRVQGNFDANCPAQRF